RPRCEFAILDTLEVNALALPGGRVFVTRGLLRAVRNGEELAGVIAHELAHVRQRHGLQHVVGSQGPMLALQLALGASPGPAGALVGDSQELLGLSYSREAENEADELGFRFLIAANIDPRGMLSFMRRLDEFDADPASPTTPTTTTHGPSADQQTTRPERVLRTHPLTPERVAHLETLWSETRRKTGFAPVPWKPLASPDAETPPE
ncbi:MAG: M48 family metallopeptidase, partial [Verrucomicrobiales bacterium]|nr:M48 family metallopeptidase [Verrucomicrobiales bacterium]